MKNVIFKAWLSSSNIVNYNYGLHKHLLLFVTAVEYRIAIQPQFIADYAPKAIDELVTIIEVKFNDTKKYVTIYSID